ncbi:TPA: hypothetical protein DEP58_02215 [Patescibacteria group bacterium]|nr:MAG: hypothetical protein UU98_C0024G0001 [Parcubacteria group bacterium GW2011_GWD2_42_14]HCC05099.1 hypothetical protein [Patescibacteria group bacterium]
MIETEKEKILQVRINKATEVVWEGEALSVSSRNAKGEFDILGMHSNFICLVRDDPIKIIQLDGTSNTYNFKQSVLFVNNNTVKIYSNIE